MAFYRQLLVFTVPSVAVLFGIYWYRRRRGFGNCDSGGKPRNTKNLKQELEEAVQTPDTKSLNCRITTPTKIIVKSAPINIIPNGSNSQRSSVAELSDKELDMEIEKAKSQKYEMEPSYKKNSKENTPPNTSVESPSRTMAKSIGKKSLSDKDDVVISLLSEQLARNSLVDDTMLNPQPEKNISRENKTDLECNSLANDRVNESVVISSLLVDCESSAKPKDVTNVDKKSSNERKSSIAKSDKPTKGNKKSKKQDKKLCNLDKKLADKKCTENKSEDVVKTDECVNISTSIPSENDIALSRDSANHSPCDTMLTSPSMGHFSDNHSEGSNDSGKGCSESPSPPPTTASDIGTPSNYLCHQFFIPKQVTGVLIGVKRSFLNKLNMATKARIYIKEHEEGSKFNICVIEGTQQDIDITLDLIRQRIPEKKFPHVCLKDVTTELLQSDYSILAYRYSLTLVEGVNNDVIISCYVTPTSLYLQQPTHPTYPSLHLLHNYMNAIYQDPTVPNLPPGVQAGMICAAPTVNNWYRTIVEYTNPENDTSNVRLLDFGGSMDISNTLLKQVRKDVMALPFQAIEVQLADLSPADGEWTHEAIQILAGLTTGQILQAQVIGYTENNIPLVYLYLTIGPQQVVSLNGELVARNLAVWND